MKLSSNSSREFSELWFGEMEEEDIGKVLVESEETVHVVPVGSLMIGTLGSSRFWSSRFGSRRFGSSRLRSSRFWSSRLVAAMPSFFVKFEVKLKLLLTRTLLSTMLLDELKLLLLPLLLPLKRRSCDTRWSTYLSRPSDKWPQSTQLKDLGTLGKN